MIRRQGGENCVGGWISWSQGDLNLWQRVDKSTEGVGSIWHAMASYIPVLRTRISTLTTPITLVHNNYLLIALPPTPCHYTHTNHARTNLHKFFYSKWKWSSQCCFQALFYCPYLVLVVASIVDAWVAKTALIASGAAAAGKFGDSCFAGLKDKQHWFSHLDQVKPFNQIFTLQRRTLTVSNLKAIWSA